MLLIASPFLALGFLAQLGIRRRWARAASVIWLALTLLAAAVFNAASAFPALKRGGDLRHFLGVPYCAEALWIIAGMTLALCSALLPLSRSFRRLCGKLCGRDEWTGVQTLALSAVISLAGIFLVPLLVLGAPPMLTFAKEIASDMNGMSVLSMYMLLFFQMIGDLAIAAIAVGYGVNRDRGEVLARLGLARPSARHLAIGVISLAILCWGSFFVEWGIGAVWQTMRWPATDAEAFGEIMKLLITPVGAVVVGVTAGLGEEVLIRGLLQPRLGILLPNLLFTALHAAQYNWDALLAVFLIGCALGLIRKWTNTTTAALAHGAYDFVLIMGAAIAMRVGGA
jgi:hypothetical protein